MNPIAKKSILSFSSAHQRWARRSSILRAAAPKNSAEKSGIVKSQFLFAAQRTICCACHEICTWSCVLGWQEIWQSEVPTAVFQGREMAGWGCDLPDPEKGLDTSFCSWPSHGAREMFRPLAAAVPSQAVGLHNTRPQSIPEPWVKSHCKLLVDGDVVRGYERRMWVSGAVCVWGWWCVEVKRGGAAAAAGPAEGRCGRDGSQKLEPPTEMRKKFLWFSFNSGSQE